MDFTKYRMLILWIVTIIALVFVSRTNPRLGMILALGLALIYGIKFYIDSKKK